MGWLIGLLAPRLGAIPAKLIAYVGIPLLIAALLWWRLDAWGDRRFDAGVAATEEKHQRAVDQLKAEAALSATRADDLAAKRLEEFEEQSAADKEALDEAKRTGSSPIDALFGGG